MAVSCNCLHGCHSMECSCRKNGTVCNSMECCCIACENVWEKLPVKCYRWRDDDDTLGLHSSDLLRPSVIPYYEYRRRREGGAWSRLYPSVLREDPCWLLPLSQPHPAYDSASLDALSRSMAEQDHEPAGDSSGEGEGEGGAQPLSYARALRRRRPRVPRGSARGVPDAHVEQGWREMEPPPQGGQSPPREGNLDSGARVAPSAGQRVASAAHGGGPSLPRTGTYGPNRADVADTAATSWCGTPGDVGSSHPASAGRCLWPEQDWPRMPVAGTRATGAVRQGAALTVGTRTGGDAGGTGADSRGAGVRDAACRNNACGTDAGRQPPQVPPGHGGRPARVDAGAATRPEEGRAERADLAVPAVGQLGGPVAFVATNFTCPRLCPACMAAAVAGGSVGAATGTNAGGQPAEARAGSPVGGPMEVCTQAGRAAGMRGGHAGAGALAAGDGQGAGCAPTGGSAAGGRAGGGGDVCRRSLCGSCEAPIGAAHERGAAGYLEPLVEARDDVGGWGSYGEDGEGDGETCGVCFDDMRHSDKWFGLLPSCDHVFCLECMRRWRSNKGHDLAVVRSCPVCRTLSCFVVPSPVFCKGEEKLRVIAQYKQALASEPCRDWSNTGKCLLGASCFFSHVPADASAANAANANAAGIAAGTAATAAAGGASTTVGMAPAPMSPSNGASQP
eukprot:jgi/Mesvir1/12572/Mv19465-RA.1